VRVIVSLCIIALPVVPLGAQDPGNGAVDSTTSSKENLYRSPHRARVLGSLIHGAGHIYAGEYVRGVLAYEATVASIGFGTLAFISDRCMFTFLNTEPCESGPAWPRHLAGVTLVGVGLWSWISSARDAPRAAERANERRRRRSLTVNPIIDPFSGPANASKIGVSVHW
jgi:hypothetical protein